MKRVLTMFAVSAVASAAVVSAGWAQSNPQAVISWGNTCPTQVANVNYAGPPPATPQTYQMWVGVKNLTAASDGNVGTDFNVFYGPNVPDAWRFDDTGCQTGSQVALNTNANNKSCPPLKGLNSLTITNFAVEPSPPGLPGSRMNIRLAITYDNFIPVDGTNYTSWNLIFDHSFSNGPDNDGDPNTCDGAARPLCFAISSPTDPAASFLSSLLLLTGIAQPFTFAVPTDQYVTWNSAAGCPGTVPTKETTWGKVKDLYH